MRGRHTLPLVMSLALLCIVGIAGMLLAEGAWDWLFFAMAAAPLALGGGRRISIRSRAKKHPPG